MSHHTCKVIIYSEDETEEYTLEVEYDFLEGEPMVMYDRNGGGYPGSDASLEVTFVKCVYVAAPVSELTQIPWRKRCILNAYEQQEIGERELKNHTDEITEKCWDDVADRHADSLCRHEMEQEDRDR